MISGCGNRISAQNRQSRMPTHLSDRRNGSEQLKKLPHDPPSDVTGQEKAGGPTSWSGWERRGLLTDANDLLCADGLQGFQNPIASLSRLCLLKTRRRPCWSSVDNRLVLSSHSCAVPCTRHADRYPARVRQGPCRCVDGLFGLETPHSGRCWRACRNPPCGTSPHHACPPGFSASMRLSVPQMGCSVMSQPPNGSDWSWVHSIFFSTSESFLLSL